MRTFFWEHWTPIQKKINPPSEVLGGGVHGKVCWLIAYIESDNKELVLNNELQRVHSWLNANRLSLNVKKTKYMLFRKHKSTEIRELNLRTSNDAVQSINDFNFLGLHINPKLNWELGLSNGGKHTSTHVCLRVCLLDTVITCFSLSK